MEDLKNILASNGMQAGRDYAENKSDHIITFPLGGRIRFFSADNGKWQKMKSSTRDILFLNECNHLEYEIFRQLSVRTRRAIFLDWNPDAEFWFELKGIEARKDTKVIHSTYKDNPFLGEEQIKAIEANKEDENWWRVYGLGLTGKLEGLVYKRWDIVEEVPEDAKPIGRGLDFGFTNDPTAIVDVYMQGGELWCKERAYTRGLTNIEIADFLKTLPAMQTVADSAEQKSIREIYNAGIRQIEPAIKGADSIKNGIDILQRYVMHFTADSLNLISEARHYMWMEDKITGEKLNTPIDKFNHLMDALRYVAINKLSERRRNTQITTFGKQR
jgi:phage terminase large subunit